MAVPSNKIEAVNTALEAIRGGDGPYPFAWYPEGGDGEPLLATQARKLSALTMLSLKSADRVEELVVGEIAFDGGFVLRAPGIGASGLPASLAGRLAEIYPALAGARCEDPDASPVAEAAPSTPVPAAEPAVAPAPAGDLLPAELAAMGADGVFVYAAGPPALLRLSPNPWTREQLWAIARTAPAGAPVFGRARRGAGLELRPESGTIEDLPGLSARAGVIVSVGADTPATTVDPATALDLRLRADPRRVELRAAAKAGADALQGWSERVAGAVARQGAVRARAAGFGAAARERPYTRLADDLLTALRELGAADVELRTAAEPEGARAAVAAWAEACAAWLAQDDEARALVEKAGVSLVPAVPAAVSAGAAAAVGSIDAAERLALSAGEGVKKFKLQARSKRRAEVVTAVPDAVMIGALAAAVRSGDTTLAKRAEAAIRGWAGGLTETLSQVLSWMGSRASFPAPQAELVEANFADLTGLVDQLVAAAVSG